MNTARPDAAGREPSTFKELLDREEALAIGAIACSVERLGEEIFEATELRARIRAHPFLATGLGAFVGFVAAPLTFGLVKRATSVSGIAAIPGATQQGILSDLLKSSLRGLQLPL